MTHEYFFWMVAVFLVAFVTAAVCWSMVRCRTTLGERDNQAALTILGRERELLRNDLAAGTLSPEHYEESLEDLRRQALDLSRSSTTGIVRKDTRIPYASALLCVFFIVTVAAALYSHFGQPRLIDFYDGQPRGGMMDAQGRMEGPVHAVDTPELYEKYLQVAPEDERVLMLLARKYAQREQWQKAADTYAKAIALNEFAARDIASLLEYSNCLMALRTPAAYAKAKLVLQKVLALNPDSFQAHQLLAIICLDAKQWREALSHLEVLMRDADPRDPLYSKMQAAAQYCRDQIAWGMQ